MASFDSPPGASIKGSLSAVPDRRPPGIVPDFMPPPTAQFPGTRLQTKSGLILSSTS
jgi:hypothetical protein